jgi:glutaredoxin 3
MSVVVIHTIDLCPYCEAARDLLTRKGVDFKEIDLTGDPVGRAELRSKAGGRTSVPQIWIGSRHVGGCDDLYALERSGELDRLLKT